MLRSISLRHFCGLTLAALVLALPPASHAQSTYTIVDLNASVAYSSSAFTSNANGQVAGYSFTTSSTTYHAVRWTGTTVEDLGTLGGMNSAGYGINASGQVTGTADLNAGSIYHAVRWTGKTIEDLGTLGGDSSIGQGINASGQVAGGAEITGSITYHAVRWTGTTAQDLGTLGGQESQGFSINDSGQVAGFAYLAGDSFHHAVRWTGSTAEDLGTLGGIQSVGRGINASGQVVGYSDLAGVGGTHAVIWTGMTAKDLGALGDGTYSLGLAINTSGDVVGFSRIADDDHAFLYTGGHMIDLNSLLPAGSSWVLTAAYGISDNGWITGSGLINGSSHAYLLKPTTISGRIALEGVADLTTISPATPLGTFHLSFRTPGTTTEVLGRDVTLKTSAGSSFGTYAIPNIPDGTYDVAIKGSKNLRIYVPDLILSGNTTLPDVTLAAGDANGDNTVDIADFNLLVEAYGSTANDGTGLYNPQADLNFDGSIDVSDFGLLANEYGTTGNL